MRQNDRLATLLGDMLSALGLLTRLPLPGTLPAPRGPAAAWAWPLAGLAVGSLAAGVAVLALAAGLPAGLAAAFALATQVMVTGAMHEDGLADTADGLWGGWDKERRLAIMKGSTVGSYAVMALVLGGLARWVAVAALLEAGAWPVLIAAGVLSRAPMAVMQAVMPNARGAGLSHAMGRPDMRTAALGVGLALGLALALAGTPAFGMALGIAAVCLGLGLVARAKIGGQTGDILGAAQQVSELAALTVAVALL
ncbi:adenosylcobinamide-GDP ribazoletransferase [Paracoccaceae bacterium Fryx2]|nr:adenosylcobinamide-GDP ribazoletransferase [Paracoccaceae bacterium Fryx2]